MKIKPEHYAYMKMAIDALPKDQVLAHKEKKLGKDIDMRFRWDLFYAANLATWVCDNCYSYLNDTHIDTALKRIVKELCI
jgi:hypothetical protein